ncbi:MAG: hypothetical protein ACRCSM_04600 [Sediminibacterium sp.]
MKKVFTNKGLWLVLALSAAIISCSKNDTETAKLQNQSDNSELSVRGNAATPISGLISQETAERMQDAFERKYSSANATEYVAFSIKDLDNYIQQLKSQYKSDSVYVSFGVYDEKTAVNKKDIGRITVFFLGKNNNAVKKGDIRGQDVTLGDGSGSNYLNHGSIWP